MGLDKGIPSDAVRRDCGTACEPRGQCGWRSRRSRWTPGHRTQAVPESLVFVLRAVGGCPPTLTRVMT